MSNLDDIRHKYAEEIRSLLKRRFNIDLQEAMVAAFARVPREHFLGPGPWLIRSPKTNRWQPFTCWLNKGNRTTNWSAVDPKYLYRHDAIVVIDPDRGLNSGQPSGLASWIHFLELRKGDRVLHIGCGVGYYTAILAEVVGPTGHVIGIEIDPGLATRARENLVYLDQVEVLQGDGGEYAPGPTDAIFVNAGVTHPAPVWLDSLRMGGRMILLLTTENGTGGVLRVKRETQGYAARFIFTASVFHCVGGRNGALSQRLHDGFAQGVWKSVRSLRREPHEETESCWLHGNGFCISTLPIPAHSQAAGQNDKAEL